MAVRIRHQGATIWSSVFFRGDDRDGLDPYFISIDPSGKLAFHIASDMSSTDVSGTMPLGRFVLLTGTYDLASNTLRLYEDGVGIEQKETVVSPMVVLDATRHPGVGLGCNNDFPKSSYNFGLDGIIDDARIYNRALSPDEVQALFQQGYDAAQKSGAPL